MYTPEDSPFEKFRTEKLKGVAMSPDVLELVAKAYEGGFIDGMQKQMQSSVDRAVNRMAEQPAQHERVQPDSECKEDDGCPTEKAVLQRFWRKAQQQEPVAWRGRELAEEDWTTYWSDPTGLPGVDVVEPLYTSPPASKPWVGLEHEDTYEATGTAGTDLLALAKLWSDNKIHVYQFDNEARKIIEAVLRRASAKLREKNA